MSSDRSVATMVPIYPALFFAAWIVTLYADSTAALDALVRPLLVGLLVVVIAQLVISGVARNRDLGAALVMIIFAALVGFPTVALVFGGVLLALLAFGILRHLSLSSLPWSSLTRLLNIVAVITVAITLVTSATAGVLTPLAGRETPRAATDRALPDIYLVLLDAYPRSDTLATDFSFDNGPFIDQMRTMGFDLSANSHSNYNLTSLTLASMFNVEHAATLPGFAESDTNVAESRALSTAINRGRALSALEETGYEIVSIPSGFTGVTLYDADRVLDSGQLTDFEVSVTQQGPIPRILSHVPRDWLLGQVRGRITSTFDRLSELASERADHPRFVFAHVISPHAPPVFGPDGETRDGWPCYPLTCTLWYGGQVYGDDALAPFADQVAYMDRQMATAADAIIEKSERPPVIVFFSDHGSRHDFDDTDEMFRSFLLASTPGHPRLLPDDATPINILPRLLNAYAGTDMAVATEESYWVDQRKIEFHGRRFDLVPHAVVDGS
jgi:hypothetical protein